MQNTFIVRSSTFPQSLQCSTSGLTCLVLSTKLTLLLWSQSIHLQLRARFTSPDLPVDRPTGFPLIRPGSNPASRTTKSDKLLGSAPSPRVIGIVGLATALPPLALSELVLQEHDIVLHLAYDLLIEEVELPTRLALSCSSKLFIRFFINYE
ncbi:unnamed protein product [Protopolystoma xenopodis]|uniref:Uncharacterized protein n=1 Tax=Protopolystoma xenopodis TaxID=117903 RepID=A0A3S5B885_9PLAT|nr:unnamed protein product [Protopolystoma xenopodis]